MNVSTSVAFFAFISVFNPKGLPLYHCIYEFVFNAYLIRQTIRNNLAAYLDFCRRAMHFFHFKYSSCSGIERKVDYSIILFNISIILTLGYLSIFFLLYLILIFLTKMILG